MSSTDLDAPPLRLVLIATILVVGLHVLTAIALVVIKAPAPKVELAKETPPLEIQMVTLPAKPAVKVAERVVAEVEETPEPKPEPTPEPKPKPEPQPQQKVEAVTQEDPVVKEEKPTVQKEAPPQKQPIKEPPVKKKIEDKPAKQKQIDADKTAADEQRRMIAAQAEKAAQKAQARTMQEANAQAAREAQAQADANAAKEAAKEAAQKAARAKAEREAEAAARAKAEADAKAAAAASNEPVNFTASAANWASAPNFSFPDRAARRARSGDTLNVVLVLRVNKQGGIDSVRVAQSSGNALLDKEAQRQVRSGKFKPFTKNGVPVVGNVTLPIAYAVP